MGRSVTPDRFGRAAAGPVRPRVVIVDMAVAPDSPAGSCVLAEVDGLSERFDVTVFSERFDARDRSGVEFVRVRAPGRPVLLRYLAFHLRVPLHYLLWRLRGGRAVCVQATQGQLPGAAICYAHFCHRAYLRHHWGKSSVAGVRRLARWTTHRFNAWCEAAAIGRARCVVVPSHGLARELATEYPACVDKLQVIPNPVAIERFRQPAEFDRGAQRTRHGFEAAHMVLGFMALGDFARKGLGLLMEAIAVLPADARAGVRVLVIGGQPGEIAEFAAWSVRLSLGGAVSFVGMQADVRPYLWACDVFAFPSSYETFGLAAMQAAAAGLPVMACDGLHGIDEFLVDGRNGWSVPRERDALATCLLRVLAERAQWPRMACAAVESAQPFARQVFQARWGDLIDALLGDSARPSPVHRS